MSQRTLHDELTNQLCLSYFRHGLAGLPAYLSRSVAYIFAAQVFDNTVSSASDEDLRLNPPVI